MKKILIKGYLIVKKDITFDNVVAFVDDINEDEYDVIIDGDVSITKLFVDSNIDTTIHITKDLYLYE